MVNAIIRALKEYGLRPSELKIRKIKRKDVNKEILEEFVPRYYFEGYEYPSHSNRELYIIYKDFTIRYQEYLYEEYKDYGRWECFGSIIEKEKFIEEMIRDIKKGEVIALYVVEDWYSSWPDGSEYGGYEERLIIFK